MRMKRTWLQAKFIKPRNFMFAESVTLPNIKRKLVRARARASGCDVQSPEYQSETFTLLSMRSIIQVSNHKEHQERAVTLETDEFLRLKQKIGFLFHFSSSSRPFEDLCKPFHKKKNESLWERLSRFYINLVNLN